MAVYSPTTGVMLYLTDACNLRCDYCFLDKNSRRMSSETARKSIEFFFSRAVSGVEQQLSITFFGGEPFLELDRMEEVIELARTKARHFAKRPQFSATTNGTVASARVERIIRDAHMALLVSMDGGVGASAHRPFISGKSSYDLVARNLPKLASWSSDTVVRMTFHPDALDLVGNVRRALDLGAPAVALCPVSEARWQGHEDTLEAAYQALADWYIDTARAGQILPLEITHGLLRQWYAHLHGGTRQERPCSVGQALLGIDPDGNVMPCHRFIHRRQDWLGTVDAPQLEKREPYLKLSSRAILGCDTCVAEPICGGGCRAVVVNAGLDLQTGAHPGYCLCTRAHARAVQRIYATLMAEQNGVFQQALRTSRPLSAAFSELVRQ